jgi:SAM-dependent methyltransferase
LWCAWALVSGCIHDSAAQGAGVGAEPAAGVIDPDRRPARTMCHTGADWLERESREQEENPTLMRASLGIAPGLVVADIGCGVGYHSVPLAELVGPTGRVIGTEMQPEYRERFLARVAAAGLSNVEFVVTSGDAADTGLPAGGVDLVLMVDVYHEVAQPQEFLRALRPALRAGGRLALVEFRAEDPSVPILPDHKMSVAQVDYELERAGYRRTGRFDGLPWQHLLFYEPVE